MQTILYHHRTRVPRGSGTTPCHHRTRVPRGSGTTPCRHTYQFGPSHVFSHYLGVEMFKKSMDFGQAGDNVGTHSFTHSSTHPLTHSLTHPLIHSLTRRCIIARLKA